MMLVSSIKVKCETSALTFITGFDVWDVSVLNVCIYIFLQFSRQSLKALYDHKQAICGLHYTRLALCAIIEHFFCYRVFSCCYTIPLYVSLGVCFFCLIHFCTSISDILKRSLLTDTCSFFTFFLDNVWGYTKSTTIF